MKTKLDIFWSELETAAFGVLMLDYDGTLAPFTVDRDQAVPYPGVRELLDTIHRESDTRLIVITGRAIDDIVPLLGLDPLPEIWGCHGWERLESNGLRSGPDLPPEAATGLDKAHAAISHNKLSDRCERKPASVALHWRGLPASEKKALQGWVEAEWAEFNAHYGLQTHFFNGGIELRCPGKDKGTAIRTVCAEIDPGIPVAFLGDDLTDEDGFAALGDNGLGILVSDTGRQTHADLRITPPDELIDFLEKWRSKSARNVVQTGRSK